MFLSLKWGKDIDSQIRSIVKYAGKKVGLDWIHPHSFRHFYATNLLRNGVNIRVVQKILGHENIKRTARYLHVVNRDLHEAVNKFEDPVLIKGKVQSKFKYLNTLFNLPSIKIMGPAGFSSNLRGNWLIRKSAFEPATIWL